jgi:mercuric reductase
LSRTNVANIYAAGVVANTPAFVYTAAHEGKIAVENAFTGTEKEVNYSSLPWVVFTDPQVAGAGLDEAQAEAQSIPPKYQSYHCGVFQGLSPMTQEDLSN